MIDSGFSYLGIEYEEAVIWVASLLCGAIVPLFAHFSVLLHAFLGIVRIKYMFRQLAIIIGCLAHRYKHTFQHYRYAVSYHYA